jgi:hypothetical protein
VLFIGYYSDDEIEKTEMGRACGMCEERRGAYRFFDGETDGKRPLERSRHGWEDNIEMDL